MKKGLVFNLLSALLLIAIGCAGPKYFLAPGFTGQKLTSGGLAILPVLIGESGAGIPGIEMHRRACGERLAMTLREKQPSLKVITPTEASSRLAQEGMVSDYAKLTENYKMTGMFDTVRAAEMAKSMKAQYFMITKIQSLYSPKEKRAIAALSTQIFDSESAEMVFETSAVYEDISIFGGPNYSRAIERTVDKLASILSVVYKAK